LCSLSACCRDDAEDLAAENVKGDRKARREGVLLIFALAVVMSGIVYSASNGVWPSLYGEMFDTASAYQEWP
jgi:hypothetical protein